jgi:hypothetical protein
MILRLIGWLGILALVPALVWLLLVRVPQASRDLHAARQRAEQELQQLAVTLKDVDNQFAHEQDRYARILRRFPWLAAPSEGTAFLTRLGQVVTGLSLKVMGIGVVQHEAIRQLEKRGRQVRVVGRFSDNLQLVENVERSKGFVEELKIQRLQPRSGEEAAEEVEAHFRLSSVELPPDVRNYLRAFLNALPDGAKQDPAVLDGVSPIAIADQFDPQRMALLRDPFRLPAALHTSMPQGAVFQDFRLVGIVASPTGRMAIINKRSVKEGERVEGSLIETIDPSEVVLSSAVGSKRITLPAFGAAAPLR